jgi:hypothetical protein
LSLEAAMSESTGKPNNSGVAKNVAKETTVIRETDSGPGE